VAAGAQSGGESPAAALGRGHGQSGPRGLSILLAQDRDAVAGLLGGLDLDVTLCWGFSWKFPQEALDVPRLGSVNQHPGRLPRHRGPYPMAWAVRDGDDVFGLTWHRMDADYDTGPILAETTVWTSPS
jgi:methionyl-tRNA formyltransferase